MTNEQKYLLENWKWQIHEYKPSKQQGYIQKLLEAQRAKDAEILMTCPGTLEDAEEQILNQK